MSESVLIECPCGWSARIEGSWLVAYKAQQLIQAHVCDLGVKEETET